MKCSQQTARKKLRGMKCTENLVACSIEVVKTKSAALHYETQVGYGSFLGADMGDVQHSRKQFPVLIATAVTVIRREINAWLSTPNAATQFPPHSYITCDKSSLAAQPIRLFCCARMFTVSALHSSSMLPKSTVS